MHCSNRNYKHFQTSVSQNLVIYLLILLLFVSFRTALFFIIGKGNDTLMPLIQVLRAYVTGLRFDTLAALVGLSPIILLSYTELFVPLSQKMITIKIRIVRILASIILISYFIIALIDLYFYQFFQSHINILIFGFFQDDTIALLHAIVNDYPIFGIFVGLIAWSVIAITIINRITVWKGFLNIRNKTSQILIAALLPLLVFIGIRGSFSDHPLRMEVTAVTTNDHINTLVCNGVYALKDAISTKKRNRVTNDINLTLKKAGFKSVNEVVETIAPNYRQPIKNVTDILINKTEENPFLEQNPPNVIFILAESMSNDYLSFHSDSSNLLGALENELNNNICFHHMIASTKATIGSLENLLVNTVQYPLSQSFFLNNRLETSSARPFKKAGYQTLFVTGGDLAWRNTGHYISHQDFDQVEGYATLRETLHFNEKHQYGAYDEYLYDYIFLKLQQYYKANKPLFTFALTVANHTPYTLPSHYKPYPFALPTTLEERMSADRDYTTRSLLGFQYANDCLGKFIQKVKESPMGKNTIIAVTGDHNIRKILDYPNEQLLQKQGVAFILYVPEAYRNFPDSINTNCIAGHKDIFPTLYHLALSNASYYRFGVNLLSPADCADNIAISESKIFINAEGCAIAGDKNRFFVWSDASKTTLQPIEENIHSSLINLLKRGKAKLTINDIAIQECLMKNKTINQAPIISTIKNSNQPNGHTSQKNMKKNGKL